MTPETNNCIWHDGMEAELYHATRALSASGLRNLSRSPAHYHENITHPTLPTPAMEFGSAAHSAVLTPEEFKEEYVRIPAGLDYRSKEGKALKADAEASGKKPLKYDAYNLALSLRDAVYAHPIAAALLKKGGAFERSWLWQHPSHGFECKCRTDFWTQEQIIIELKTTTDARIGAFRNKIADQKYHLAVAWYSDGISVFLGEQPRYAFIVVEAEPPHGVCVYTPEKEMIDAARMQIAPLVSVYADCLASNEWPNYPPIAQPISLPYWEMKKITEGDVIYD